MVTTLADFVLPFSLCPCWILCYRCPWESMITVWTPLSKTISKGGESPCVNVATHLADHDLDHLLKYPLSIVMIGCAGSAWHRSHRSCKSYSSCAATWSRPDTDQRYTRDLSAMKHEDQEIRPNLSCVRNVPSCVRNPCWLHRFLCISCLDVLPVLSCWFGLVSSASILYLSGYDTLLSPVRTGINCSIQYSIFSSPSL